MYAAKHFFVELGGWDLHSLLIEPHRLLLRQLDDALGDFQKALNADGAVGSRDNIYGIRLWAVLDL